MDDVIRELLKEKLEISISVEDDYYRDIKRVSVQVTFDGEEITSDYDTFSIED